MIQKEYVIKKTLDASGLTCPEPVMLLHKTVRESESGDYIEVIATDPSTQRDIPKFCEFLGHKLVYDEQKGNRFVYHICKGGKV